MVFVFLHVGPDVLVPTLLVKSIRAHLPDAEIIQCTDFTTTAIEGVDRVSRHEGDVGNLMTFRLAAFRSLAFDGIAAYVDTDMLLIRPFDPAEILDANDVAVCRRSFGGGLPLNPVVRGVELSEYRNRTLDEVYPYLACFTVVRGHGFWADCHDELMRLPEKFQRWFGDQEAIRNVVGRGRYTVGMTPERTCACLIEHLDPKVEVPFMVHFKGPKGKRLLSKWADRLNLL